MTKKQEIKKMEKQNDRLLAMIAEEKEKVKGYEQLAKVHSAYISILLKKLGATKDNMFAVTASEVKEALQKYEARAEVTDDTYNLYCEIAD